MESRSVVGCGVKGAVLLASVVLLSGCATTAAVQPSAGTSIAGSSMSGMSGDESSAPPSGGATPTSSAGGTTDGGPSASAQMICGSETKDNLAKMLTLSEAPHSVDSWADKLYTCTYHLADGPLVLSVKESADANAAHGYFDAMKATLGSTHTIDGLANLGLPAYENTDGSVVFVKDNMTLHVDASQLPEKVGPHAVSRNDLSYEIATAILACWSGK